MEDEVRKYMSEIGKKGGGKRTQAQVDAWKVNCKKGGAKAGNSNWKGRLKKDAN